MDTVPHAGDRSARFWDRTADKYARRPMADDAAYRHKLEQTQKRLRPGMHRLETGCGTGSTAIEQAAHVERIHATDFSQRMIEIGRDKARAAGVDTIEVETASLADVASRGHRYDAVLALSVLHLVEDLDGALADIHELVRPGGLFVSNTGCLADGMNWLRPILAVGRWFGKVPPVLVLHRADLLQRMQDVGFEVEYEYRTGSGRVVFLVARRQ
ncbi:class I SAM-dependent methyltransferase [Wenzhouxiangella sp. XN79A]|uniref:class I SAM-dependent methyltransferase n=1 Tax=Wenzhouxiangella sp. XN79A TaxID=2724193 RepID=UPI00144A5FA4|nr:class I SAM-dependent methyltransferase [Wenzhouxiangella sp. XN79A]NKI36137.1 class I SAM-dependent methyltransferase [Wenzhouxiangella sp. XN79A]